MDSIILANMVIVSFILEKNVLLQFSALFEFFMHTRECHIVNASDADFKVFHL